ncbi:GNAT family N-acetyltransferase [Flagellimonas okinawensis]|uniref:GNAT family N-acetyltransferase n=1 Tax=Flagellimonas okinawensis TaxID=3031324 RepID=A0ABT5XLN8_9FLAO|nr:GNAT family N-acetyltransferase [[Muricauda] okinawensis]MDF0706807.1 GNAT family N-acetyltransferase [[Muricauda] okinawensis]
MSCSIQKCTKADLGTLVNLSKVTFRDAFESANDPNDFASYLHQAFHTDKMLSELLNPNSFFYFILNGEEVVGYFKLNIASAQTDLHDSRGMEIERIYVLSSHQGKSIGSWVLKEIKSLARGLNKDFLWLGVWEKNPNAIRFYQRHGFTKIGEHPYFIGSDEQTDWLMKLVLQ